MVKTLLSDARGTGSIPGWGTKVQERKNVKKKKKKCNFSLNFRTSLVIQWLRLHFLMQAVWVQSLVGELSKIPHSLMAKKPKHKTEATL